MRGCWPEEHRFGLTSVLGTQRHKAELPGLAPGLEELASGCSKVFSKSPLFLLP